ncbi:TetR/AcrR family transcriptional regulator [Rhodococcus qingshengii]|uniref:TetR/AcrR family transcriptional regulator n=1 Tax=Rhodococcus qingshengii TaxID=334542 RepID=UPI0010A5C06D|nr:TetR/AcrR family transcriptional regulator [Rhodococcus qingshengii]THJ64744.1 TetR/AcrR family transcriptional regulator [Rhodococcus qingshengii]
MSAAEPTASDVSLVGHEWQTYPDLAIPPILAAALDHFHQRGYHGTSIRNIATGVGLTMPTLYYHYGNKEGILYALLEVALDDLQMHTDMCLADADGDTLRGFKNLVCTIALHYTNRRDLATLHAESRFLGPKFRGQYVARRSVVEDTLEDLIRKGIAEGIFDEQDPHFTTRMLLGMLGGILDWYSESGPLSPAEIAERYTHSSLRIVSRNPAL